MAARQTTAQERVELTSGIYRIIAGYRHEQAVAAAYAGPLCIGRCEASNVDDAISAVQNLLSARRAAFKGAREGDRVSAGEMRDLLATLSAPRRARLFPMLNRHARFPGAIATADVLARRSECSPDLVWKEYVWLGRKMVTALGVPLKVADRFDHPHIAPVLAFAELIRASFAHPWEIALRSPALEVIGDLQAEQPFLVVAQAPYRRVG